MGKTEIVYKKVSELKLNPRNPRKNDGAVEITCAIGDSMVYIEDDGFVETIPYRDIVDNARNYIKSVGGFEKFAEWGLF